RETSLLTCDFCVEFFCFFFFFFQAEDGIRDLIVTGVQTCALPISERAPSLMPRDLSRGMSDGARSVLEVRDVHTYYGESHVLHGVSLTVAPGQVVTILGRNGMGKTTLIRSVIGFTPARRGSIHFKGRDVTHWPSFRMV